MREGSDGVRRARDGDGVRPDQRAAGVHGGLPGCDDGGRRRGGAHHRDGDGQRRHRDERALPEDARRRDRVQHRALRHRDPGVVAEGERRCALGDQAAGGPLHDGERQPHHPAGAGPPGEPGLRERPPVVRDVELVLQPGAGPAGDLDEPDDGEVPPRREGQRVLPAEGAGREGGCAAPGQAGREADEADAEAGLVHQLRRRGPVQAVALPLLRAYSPLAASTHPPRCASDPLTDTCFLFLFLPCLTHTRGGRTRGGEKRNRQTAEKTENPNKNRGGRAGNGFFACRSDKKTDAG
mmetsp:Transcript_42885/g.49715  ORF Transcript_42885/g.49715 Transcript_42885/m.49715 type:complete len:295 (+) Transcript_42885:736-1620(+)